MSLQDFISNAEYLASFLSGTLITLVVRELINMWNSKQEFDRSLMRITYEKRSQIAEDAVAHHFTMLRYSHGISTSIQVFLEALQNFEQEQEKDFTQLGKIVTYFEIQSAKLEEEEKFINSVHLYFDLKDEWSDDEHTEWYNVLNELGRLNSETQLLDKDYMETEDETREIEIEAQVLEIAKEVKPILETYDLLLSKKIKSIESYIKEIKKQLKAKF